MIEQVVLILIGALSAGTITAIGWFVSHYLSRRKELDLKRKEIVLNHLKRQIDEFYGPLLGLCLSSRFAFETSKKQLPMCDTGYDFAAFDEHHWEIYDYYTEKYFLPNNAKMSDLINLNLSLLEESSYSLPESLNLFLKHQTEFECLHNNYIIKKMDRIGKKQPYEVVAKESKKIKLLVEDFPVNFEKTIRESLERIETRYHNYLKGIEP